MGHPRSTPPAPVSHICIRALFIHTYEWLTTAVSPGKSPAAAALCRPWPSNKDSMTMGKPRSCHSGSQPRVITEPTRRGAGGPRAPASGQLLSAAVSADAPTFQTSPGHRNEAWVCSHVATRGTTGPEDSESQPKRPYRAGPAPDPPTWCLSDPRRGCAEASATPMRI